MKKRQLTVLILLLLFTLTRLLAADDAEQSTTPPVEATPATSTAPVTDTPPAASTTPPAAGSTESTAPTTSVLPGETGTPTTGEGASGSDVTPPPTPTPVLPARAKQGNLMVKAGDKEVEWRLAYSHYSTNTVFVDGVAMLPVMVIGQVGVETVRKDILIGSLAMRYGVMDNVQAEVVVPYRSEVDDNEVPAGQSSQLQESTISGQGMGDVEANMYFQLPKISNSSVRWIANLGVKSATGSDIFDIDPTTTAPMGTGFWSTKVGLTGVALSDPAALYWNFGYTYNWERNNICVVNVDQTTGQDEAPQYYNVKPGDTIDIGGGFAYALNPRLSVNTGLDISFNASSTSDGIKLPNTCITSAALRLGLIWLTQKQQPIDIAVSIGLTRDSPDFTLEWRKGFKF